MATKNVQLPEIGEGVHEGELVKWLVKEGDVVKDDQPLAEIMTEHGFDRDGIERVGALVRKERLKQDADVQALEDVVCVVFLTHYLTAFAAKHDADKLADILAKTWRKMSSRGHAAASSLGLPEHVLALLKTGLVQPDGGPVQRL